jgi:hypothetical protein
MKAFKTDDPDFNGNRLTGDWGGNGDPYLTIIEADADDNIKGCHSVRVAFSGGNFPSDIKCMVGMLVNMIKRYEPYIDDDGRFNSGKYAVDCYHGKVKEPSCDNFIHEASSQAYTYKSANGKHEDVYMLGCAVGIKWILEKFQEFIDAQPDDGMLKLSLRLKIADMLKTE